MGVFVGIFSYYLHYRVVSKSIRCPSGERWFVHCISKEFERFTSSTGNVEICFYYLRGYVKRYNEILVFILIFHNILFVLIFHKTKKQTQSTTRCTKTFFRKLHIVCPRHFVTQLLLILWTFWMRWNRHETKSFIIIRKCAIAKCSPANITKSFKKKNANTESKF